MADSQNFVFGLADITIGEGSTDPILFNGSEYLQVEGGELTLTPLFTEFSFADFGETVVERRLSGWEGSLTISAGQETAEILELALGVTEPITDATTAEQVGSMDARIGTTLAGKKVRIHPRSLPATDQSKDFVIYNMSSTEGLTKSYDAEQGSIDFTLTMLPREGFDASKPGNFFYRGTTDPNA